MPKKKNKKVSLFVSGGYLAENSEWKWVDVTTSEYKSKGSGEKITISRKETLHPLLLIEK